MSASRYLCAIALLLVTLGALPKPQPGGAAWTDTQIARLHENVDAALEAPALQGAYVGLLAIDTVRGTVLVLHGFHNSHFQLEGAAKAPLAQVRDDCLRARGKDVDAAYARIHTHRSFKEYVDAEGAWNGMLRGTVDAGLAAAPGTLARRTAWPGDLLSGCAVGIPAWLGKFCSTGRPH